MDFNKDAFEQIKTKTQQLFDAQKDIRNPYLKNQVIFNSDGFHHLQFSGRRERNKSEQWLKLSLVPLAIEVIKNSGTLQEYRKELVRVGKQGKDGLFKTKEAEYWGFVAIVGQSQIKIRVVLRRIGDGNIIFWSVMPYSKLRRGERQKLYTDGIEDE